MSWLNDFIGSTEGRLLLSKSPYMQARERQMEQEGQASQLGGLLDQYRQAPDPNALPLGNNPAELDQSIMRKQGGFRQPGGLLGNMPPSDFYLEAAKIPGLTQPMLNTAQQQQAAMDRQVQDQTWRQSNMTASEFANHQLNTQKLDYQKERDDLAFNGLSAYQKAMLGRMGGGGGGGGGVAQPGMAQIGAVPSGHMMTMDPVTGQPVLTPLQGGEQWRGQRENVQRLNTGVAAMDEMIDFVKSKGSFETGAESGRISAGPRQAAIAGLAALNNMGVLQPGELAILERQIVDPNAWGSLLQNDSTALGKLQGVRDRFVKASKEAGSRTPGAASAPQPPAGFR